MNRDQFAAAPDSDSADPAGTVAGLLFNLNTPDGPVKYRVGSGGFPGSGDAGAGCPPPSRSAWLLSRPRVPGDERVAAGCDTTA